MARDLKYRGWTSSYDPAKYNVSRYGSASQQKLNLTDRGYPSSTSGMTMNTGYTTPTFTNTSTSKGKSSGVSNSMANLQALLAAYQNQKNPWEDYLNQRRSMVRAAYDNSMGALNSAYGEYMAALQENLNSANSALSDSYNRSKKNVQDDARESLKQAYINKMLSEKNFDQQMSAQGLSGGASETTRAAMSNNYGNARNNINTTTNRNLSELEGQYNQNVAEAYQAYNQAAAQAQLQKAQMAMQLEQMLAEGEMGALDSYYSMMDKYGGLGGFEGEDISGLLASIVQNGSNYDFTPTTVTNNVSNPEVIQANTMQQRSYANLMEALKNIMSKANGNGMPTNNNNYLTALLRRLRGA